MSRGNFLDLLPAELEALAVSLPSGDRAVAEELRRLRRQVGRSVREARDSILQLRSNSMSPVRLADSLQGLADATALRYGVRPSVTVTGRRSENVVEIEAHVEPESILYTTLLLFGGTIVAAALTFAVIIWLVARRGRADDADVDHLIPLWRDVIGQA